MVRITSEHANEETRVCVEMHGNGADVKRELIAVPSDGYDDLVNAEDQCRYWSDGKEGVLNGNPLERHDGR